MLTDYELKCWKSLSHALEFTPDNPYQAESYINNIQELVIEYNLCHLIDVMHQKIMREIEYYNRNDLTDVEG